MIWPIAMNILMLPNPAVTALSNPDYASNRKVKLREWLKKKLPINDYTLQN